MRIIFLCITLLSIQRSITTFERLKLNLHPKDTYTVLLNQFLDKQTLQNDLEVISEVKGKVEDKDKIEVKVPKTHYSLPIHQKWEDGDKPNIRIKKVASVAESSEHVVFLVHSNNSDNILIINEVKFDFSHESLIVKSNIIPLRISDVLCSNIVMNKNKVFLICASELEKKIQICEKDFVSNYEVSCYDLQSFTNLDGIEKQDLRLEFLELNNKEYILIGYARNSDNNGLKKSFVLITSNYKTKVNITKEDFNIDKIKIIDYNKDNRSLMVLISSVTNSNKKIFEMKIDDG